MNVSNISLLSFLLVFPIVLVGCSDDSTSDTSGGGLNGSVDRESQTIPFDFSGLSFAPSAAFVNVEGFALEFPEIAGLPQQEQEQIIHEDARIYVDEDGEQWRPLLEVRIGSLVGASNDSGRGLNPTESRMIPVLTADPCEDRCTLRIRLSAETPLTDTSVREESWEENGSDWVYAELEYSRVDRIAMNRLTNMDEETLDGTFELGTIFVEGDFGSVSAELAPMAISVYDRQRVQVSSEELGEGRGIVPQDDEATPRE